MEPSSVEDGNPECWQDVSRYHALLQWSRPQLRTETWRFGRWPITRSKLQWSRPQLRTETRAVGGDGICSDDASMEPSSVEDGNRRKPACRVRGVRASMEPSSVEDGNSRPPPVLRFTARLQWSRPQLRTETLATLETIEAAGGSLQWSRPQLRTETSIRTDFPLPGLPRFNGAVLS